LEFGRIRKWISRGRAGLNLTGSWLSRHADEPFVILTGARVPADNNGSERDIRSLVAARSELGGQSKSPLAERLRKDTELDRLVHAWPTLPQHIRAAIVALLDSVS